MICTHLNVYKLWFVHIWCTHQNLICTYLICTHLDVYKIMICTHLNVYKCVCCTHLDVYKIDTDVYTDVYKPSGGSQYTTLRFQYISKNILDLNLRTICLIWKNLTNTNGWCVWRNFLDFYRVWVAYRSKKGLLQIRTRKSWKPLGDMFFVTTFRNRAVVLAKELWSFGRRDTKKGTEKTPYGIKLVNTVELS